MLPWWIILVALVVGAVIGYTIGYRRGRKVGIAGAMQTFARSLH